MPSVPLKADGECRWCGESHPSPLLCPWVKALEFSSGDEHVTRVEFLTPADCDIKNVEEPGETTPAYPTLKPISGA